MSAYEIEGTLMNILNELKELMENPDYKDTATKCFDDLTKTQKATLEATKKIYDVMKESKKPGKMATEYADSAEGLIEEIKSKVNVIVEI